MLYVTWKFRVFNFYEIMLSPNFMEFKAYVYMKSLEISEAMKHSIVKKKRVLFVKVSYFQILEYMNYFLEFSLGYRELWFYIYGIKYMYVDNWTRCWLILIMEISLEGKYSDEWHFF
jgi:hypothetical protein